MCLTFSLTSRRNFYYRSNVKSAAAPRMGNIISICKLKGRKDGNMTLGVFSMHAIIWVSKEGLVLKAERCSNWHYLRFSCLMHSPWFTLKERKLNRWSDQQHIQTKDPFRPHNTHRLFLVLRRWRRMKDSPQRKECGSCCGLRRSCASRCRGGMFAFFIWWPLGCLSQGLPREEGWKKKKMGVYGPKLEGSEV